MTISLTVSGVIAPGAGAQPGNRQQQQSGKDQGKAEAADVLAARLAARLSGRRVEALSERTETSTTWVNPEGSLTTEVAAGPVRFQRDGRWVDVDLTLQRKSDGSVAAVAHPKGLSLGVNRDPRPRSTAEAARAQARDLVTVGTGEHAITLQWKGGLPAPELSGPVATYRDVLPDADLAVEATRSGFEQFVDIKKRPAEPVSYVLPVRLTGVRAVAQPDGGVLFADAKDGRELAVMPAPVMWDSTVDERSGENVRRAPVGVEVVPVAAGVELHLTPDPAFLNAPETKYPVRVDPAASALTNVFDTFVETTSTWDESASTELKIGTSGTVNGQQSVARSFITWDTARIAGTAVVGAQLNLFNFHSWSCTPREWQVWSTAGEAGPSTRWANQPAMQSLVGSSMETRRANSSCASPGYVGVDVTNLARQWADARAQRGTTLIRAANENDTYAWKKFYSGNAAAGQVPVLSVTYNQVPNAGTDLQAGPPFLQHNGEFQVRATTPTLQFRTGDANGDFLQSQFWVQNGSGSTVFDHTTAPAPAGTVASVTVPDGRLVNGQTYRFQVRSYDGMHWGPWSGATSFVVDTTKPSAPTAVSSTDYPTGQWVRGAGQTGTFTATPPSSDHHWLEWSLDGAAWTKVPTGGTGGAKSFQVTPGRDGTHFLQVRTADKAENRSEPVRYTFHAGPGGLVEPAEGQRTARRLPLVAEADASKYGHVSFFWRRSDADPWTPLPVGQVTSGGQPITAWPVPLTNGRNTPLVWNATDTVNPDGNVQLTATFTGPNGATGGTDPITVVVDRESDAAASEGVGPGNLNLLTGNYTLSATEVAPFGLSVGRTASSRQPAAGSDQEGQAAVFGDEWAAGVASTLGDTTYSHVRKTSDTSLDVVLEDGTEVHFTTNADRSGWVPQPGAARLALTGGFADGFTLSDTDGTVTTFGKVDPAATTWQVTSSLVRGLTNSSTTVVSEKVVVAGKTLARPKRVIAPSEAATAAACQANPATRGCRVLEFDYAGTTTATSTSFGDYAGQVRGLVLWATDPGATAATATIVSAYAYDDQGRLREVWDPRISPALKTGYDYDGAGRVVKLAPPGLLPWTFAYGVAGGSSAAGEGMLLKVSRAALKQGTADVVEGEAVTSVVYGVPLDGSAAPHAMHPAAVAAWGQTEAPTDATAVFPPDVVPSSHTGAQLAAGDYRRAALTYLNASGWRVNTAEPGGGITTAEHDHSGAVARELSAANRALALGADAAQRARLAELGIESLSPAERAFLLSNRAVHDREGLRKLEELGPLHRVTLAADLSDGTKAVAAAGTTVVARPRTVLTYDEGRPTDGSATVRDQVTKVTADVQLRDHPALHADARVTTTGYDWAKGLEISTTEDPGGQAITRRIDYDNRGRVVKTSLPKSNGADAAAVVTSYYTADGTGACGGRPEWAGQFCRTAPAGDVAGGAHPSQLVTRTVEYDRHGSVTKTTETANGVTRTTTVRFDTAGRPRSTTVVGGVGATVPEVSTEYDPATGQAVRTTSPTGGAITRGFDKLGRTTSYTDADGGTTTTEFDRLSRPVKVTDSVPSTTTYAYDHNAEPRGMATAITDSVAGTFTAVYDVDGGLVESKLPGGYTLRQGVDTASIPVARVYTRDSDGATVLADTVARSAHGQVLKRSNSAEASAQTYRYDGAGRLTGVDDSANGVCTARTYAYDKHSNRTSRTVAAGGLGQVCPTSGGTTTTHAHDAADRLVDAGYGYDAFGRTTTLPGGGSLEYYANDLGRRQVVGGTRLTLTLDAGLRFRTATTETESGGTWGNGRTKVNHYSCDCDKPAWTTTGTDVVRHVNGVEEGLSATTGKTGDVRLQLTTLHGDVSVVLSLANPSNPVVQANDEFGNPRDPAVKPVYGWLGGSQRAADTPTGLVLMGVRLYAPALGRFLQVDPVHGGSDNAYEYGEQDPVNNVDLDGRASRNLTTGYSGMNRYERARCAWYPGQCGTYLWISSWAMSTARMWYPRWERGQNAFRHCIWQALLLVYMGWGNAVAWGDAHEGDDRSNDHWTDLHNNSWGRWAGAQVRWWQTPWAKDIAMSKCYWLLSRGYLRTW